MATRVRSYSKINLGLAIGPVRADGFHGLATLYQTLALHDVVTVEARILAEESDSDAAQGFNADLRPAEGSSLVPGPAAQARIARAFSPKDGVGEGSGFEVRGSRLDQESSVEQGASDPTSQNRDVGHPEQETNAGVLRSAQNDKPVGLGRISLTTNHPGVPTDGRNTAWKMVELALARMGVAAEVKIHIQKNLPVQGGMGAGSANAAAALIGLERELGFSLSELARMELAAEVGSDVPLFLLGGAVLGTERGERVCEMPDLPKTWCVVAVPEVGVSTPRAFRDWDEGPGSRLGASGSREDTPDGGLTSPAVPDRLKQLSHVYASVFGPQTSDTSGIVRSRQDSFSSETKQGGFGDVGKTSGQGGVQNDLAGNTLLALVRTGIGNDFEQVVFPQYPLLREIKRLLMGTPADGLREGRPDDLSGKALYAALSGSGSALFGLYGSESDARAAQQRVQSSGCKAILTETLPRAEYWGRMFAE